MYVGDGRALLPLASQAASDYLQKNIAIPCSCGTLVSLQLILDMLRLETTH